MAVQTPPAPPTRVPAAERVPAPDAGVIEDARARQRRHRRIGVLLVAAAAAAGLLSVELTGGGGGGSHSGGQPSDAGAGPGPFHAPASNVFADAPATQLNGYGVETGACPLAPPNRYLPPRSGCVTARRADVDGDGRPDLVLVYSRLSSRHPSGYVGGVPASLQHDFMAEAAFLKIVLADGAGASRRIAGTRAAAIDAIAHVNRNPGREIFLEVARISSGATAAAYGLDAGRLVSAGPLLSYGGDSASKAGFDCRGRTRPHLIQRTFELIGSTVTGPWRQTDTTYVWRGPRLVEKSSRTFTRLGAAANLVGVGNGCVAGIG